MKLINLLLVFFLTWGRIRELTTSDKIPHTVKVTGSQIVPLAGKLKTIRASVNTKYFAYSDELYTI